MTQFPNTLAVIQGGLEHRLHIGAQVYISRDAQPLLNYAVGLARPGMESDPEMAMTPESIMLWFSACKPVTAIAIAQLVEQGRLDLQVPVAAVMPEFGVHGKDVVTPWHILTHTAGLRTTNLGWPQTPYEQIIQRLCEARMEPNWIPGEAAGYHAFTSWFILGELVRRVSGEPIHTYLKDHLFTPLGLVDSFLALSAEEYAVTFPRMGIMQRTDKANDDPPKISTMHADTLAACTNPRPPGSGHGPIRDLGVIYETLLHGGTHPALGSASRILRPETVRQFTSTARSGLPDKTFGNLPLNWGLGFMTNSRGVAPTAPYQFGPYASDRTFGHHGSQSSVGCCDPEHGLVVAYVFNGCPGDVAHDQRLREVFSAIYEDLGLTSGAG